MGHEADLKASLEQELSSYNLEIEIVDILRDKKDLQFKREADANVVKENNQIIIKEFLSDEPFTEIKYAERIS